MSQNRFQIPATNNSPKVIIDFAELLFEIEGDSFVEEALAFYQPIFNHISNDFFEVKQSIYHRNDNFQSLTLHFYMSYVAMQDFEMIRQIDYMFSKISAFQTYIYWYYFADNEDSVSMAQDVEQTFINKIRLIKHIRK